MSETPMENYKNYMKIMDSFTINEELQKINAIHSSLDEQNPITYAILLDSNRKWFTLFHFHSDSISGRSFS